MKGPSYNEPFKPMDWKLAVTLTYYFVFCINTVCFNFNTFVYLLIMMTDHAIEISRAIVYVFHSLIKGAISIWFFFVFVIGR